MIQELKFEKLKKKFALNNSYFKNRQHNAPSNPFEVLEYYKEHNDLPYENGTVTNDWFYQCFIEFQKRAGVHNQQFFTPTNTAIQMADLAKRYTQNDDVMVLDACCGFGQITRQLANQGFSQIIAFDNDTNLVDACHFFCGNDASVYQYDFKSEEEYKYCFDLVVANPPYDGKDLTEFLSFVYSVLYGNGIAILLIPQGFLDKTRPANLVQILNKFSIKERIKMSESFARTGTAAEIVVLSK